MTKTKKSPLNAEESLDTLSYEQAFAALEAVVASLESDKQSLDEALGLFERGQLLARRLSSLLDQAELKVKQLAGDQLVDFDASAPDQAAR